MTIILFVVDTSASMAQRHYQGTTYLDFAKAIIDGFLKQRSKDLAARGMDRYMLMTTEEPWLCVKTGWKEGNMILNEQLRCLTARGKSCMHSALLSAFEFINLNRAQSGIDNYGCGRVPYFFEQVVVVAITDGNGASTVSPDALANLNAKVWPGSELTKEAFRWDQRILGIVLRLPCHSQRFVHGTKIEPDAENFDRLCSQTGGRSFKIYSHRQIGSCIETLVQNLHVSGVNVRFDCPMSMRPNQTNGEDSSSFDGLTPEQKLRKRLAVRPLTLVMVRPCSSNKYMGNWPIPEAFWHERLEHHQSLPQRRAHPQVVFTTEPVMAQVQIDFPFDKYELEPGPVSDFVLEKYDPTKPNLCFQVFVRNSGKSEGVGKPFGYLKKASNGQSVNIFFMPYNYPALNQLLEEYKDPNRQRNGASNWRQKMDRYLEGVPPYYLHSLRRALAKFKISGGLLDEQTSLTQFYPNQVLTYLNRIKGQGKEQFELACTKVAKHLKQAVHLTHPLVQMECRVQPSTVSPTKNAELRFGSASTSMHVPTKKTRNQLQMENPRIRQSVISSYRNPLVVGRRQMLDQLIKTAANMEMMIRETSLPILDGGLPGRSLTLQTAEEMHNLPIVKMGEYEVYVKGLAEVGLAPLREIEPQPVRAHAFGNPFKTDKKNMAIDEVGESVVANSKETRKERKETNAGRPPKRKPGPLAYNSMGLWRDRRKSLSEVSSVMSEPVSMSDVEDSDMADFAVPSSSEDAELASAFNGAMDEFAHNGEVEFVKVVDLKTKRKKELNGDVIVIKKPRMERCLLTREEVRERQLQITSVVRKPSPSGDQIFNQIEEIIVLNAPCEESLQLLLRYSVRELTRFKLKNLIPRVENIGVKL